MIPEVLTTLPGIFANLCFVASIAITICCLRNDMGYISWSFVFLLVGGLLCLKSVHYLNEEKITNFTINPLVDIEKVSTRGYMSKIPYRIEIIKKTLNRRAPKTFKYSYNADLFIQQSELISIKNKADEFYPYKIKKNKKDYKEVCTGIRYGNRAIEVIRRGNYKISC